MKQTIYVDVLLALNFFINYFLLLSVARIMRARVSRTRICLGAVLGAACSLTLFLPPMGMAPATMVKTAICSGMVLVSFRVGGARGFIRYLLVTCAVTFGFGGAMLALWLTLAPRGMYYRNGTVYFSLSPVFVIAVTVACYSLVTIAGRILRKMELRGGECGAVIRGEGREGKLRLIFDTGNLLTEPFSGLPVIVAGRNSLSGVMPEGFPSRCQGCNFRVIPYSAVGGDGLLCAFRPECTELRLGKQLRRVDCYIAVSDDFNDRDYDGIINPAIFED